MADSDDEDHYGKQGDDENINIYENDYNNDDNEYNTYDKSTRQKPSTVFKSSVEFADDEKLTDPNWEDYPWVPPSIDKAKEYPALKKTEDEEMEDEAD